MKFSLKLKFAIWREGLGRSTTGQLGYILLGSHDEGLAMRYKIRLQKTDEGFSVSCPGLPGCWSQGATETEAIENIQDAIQDYLAAVNDSLRGDDVREVDIPG